jgi:hypothetical protein
MLEKAPSARPASAAEVIAKLRLFAPATSRGARSTETLGTPSLPPPPTERSSGDLPSRRDRQDTVALVERATRNRSIPTPLAITLTVLLSLAAGLAARAVKVSAQSAEPLAPVAAER